MIIRFLGTGTSTGVPEVGCNCEVCKSKNPHDWRLRTSLLVDILDKRFLLDCGPDFREQIKNLDFRKIDGVLLTHEHYDHVGGLDDLRPFCRFGNVEVYCEEKVETAIRTRIPYCFAQSPYPGVPKINLNKIDYNKPFYIDNILITPIRVMHGKLPIIGFRIGDMAYLTDVSYIPDEEFKKLKNLKILVIDALRYTQHISHETVDEAIENINRIKPKKSYLIHMSHHIGLHATVETDLPKNIILSYDGLCVKI